MLEANRLAEGEELGSNILYSSDQKTGEDTRAYSSSTPIARFLCPGLGRCWPRRLGRAGQWGALASTNPRYGPCGGRRWAYSRRTPILTGGIVARLTRAWTKWPTYGRRSGRSQLDSPRLPSPRCRRPIQMRRRLAGPSRPASRRASGPASGRRSSFGRPQGVAACCRRASKQEGVRAGTCGNAMRTLPHAAMAPATRPI
jgi:hypothetical protein